MSRSGSSVPGKPSTASSTDSLTSEGLWPWMEQEQRQWLIREQTLWLKREAETEAQGSRDFGRGFMYVVALIEREGGVEDVGPTDSVRSE